MKTAHPGLRSRSHFQSQATHKHLSNPDHQFSDPNHEKVTQMSPHGSPKGIPNPPKIYKNPCLDSHVSPWVSLGTPGSLKWCSKAPKWCPNGVPITPNGVPITQNGHKLPNAPTCPASPVNPASPDSPSGPANHQLTKGPAAGAKP